MLFNQYVFKYKQGFYGHREYDSVYSIALIDSLSLQEFIFIVNNLNYKMPYYLSILNIFSIFLFSINIFELYLPKKRIITFIEELNNEYSNRLISFHINQEEDIVLLYPLPDHFYKNVPFPFFQIHQPIQQDQNQQLQEPLPGKQYQEQQKHETYTSIDFQPIIETNQYSEPLLSEIEEYTPIDLKEQI
ncbi:hypothetical protein ACTFIT_011300 [Dictyostelium discoideum]